MLKEEKTPSSNTDKIINLSERVREERKYYYHKSFYFLRRTGGVIRGGSR